MITSYRDSDSLVVRSMCGLDGKVMKWVWHHAETAQPMWIMNNHNDYVLDRTPHANFHEICISGFSPADSQNIHPQCIFFWVLPAGYSRHRKPDSYT